jgi:hypothetical protein
MRVATKEAVVDLPDDYGDPSPLIWPECDVCHVPYVLRLAYSLTRGRTWAWMKDCAKPRSTCKNAGATIHDMAGEVPPDGR